MSSSNNSNLQLKVILDAEKSDINKQIKEIQKKLNPVKLKVELDDPKVKSLTKQLEKATSNSIKNLDLTGAIKKQLETHKIFRDVNSIDSETAKAGTRAGMTFAMAYDSAVASYHASKQAKTSGEAFSLSLSDVIKGGISGAIATSYLGPGALVGAIAGAAIPAVSSLAGWIGGESQRAIDKTNELMAVNAANLQTLKSLRDEFNHLSKGVGNYGVTIFAPYVAKVA